MCPARWGDAVYIRTFQFGCSSLLALYNERHMPFTLAAQLDCCFSSLPFSKKKQYTKREPQPSGRIELILTDTLVTVFVILVIHGHWSSLTTTHSCCLKYFLILFVFGSRQSSTHLVTRDERSRDDRDWFRESVHAQLIPGIKGPFQTKCKIMLIR